MDMRSWRAANGLTLQSLGEKLGVDGVNSARTINRWETGQSPCPADIVERLRLLSDGAVTPSDFHDVRLAFLRSQSAEQRAPEPVA